MAESVNRIPNYVTKDSLKVRNGNPGTTNFTKNIRLNEIKNQIPNGVKIDFWDLNGDGYVDPKEMFSYINGDEEIFYYSIAKGDSFGKIKKEQKIQEEDVRDCKRNKKGEIILNAGNFLKFVRPIKEKEIEATEEIKTDVLEINKIGDYLEDVKSDVDEFSKVSEEDLKLIENKFNGRVVVSQNNGYIILNLKNGNFNLDSYENYISLGKIKKFLDIKDGVLRKENDLEGMNTEGWGNYDNMTLKTDSNLKIPIEDINLEKLRKNKK